MAITSLSDLAIKVVADMPGFPPENLVQDKLRWAWERLLDRSEVWREELDPIDAVQDQADYTLSPSEGVVIRVITVKLSESVISPLGYKMTGLSTLTFETDYIPSEDITDGIEVEVALAPDIDSTTGPAWVLQRHYTALVHGARFALYRQLRKPWSDPIAAEEQKELWEYGLAKAIEDRRYHRTTRKTGFRAYARPKV